MNRTKLIWFAGGVATALLSFYATKIFLAHPTNTRETFLIVFAPDIVPEGSDFDDLNSLSLTTGQVLRRCGAKQFTMYLNPHHGNAYEMPVTAETSDSLECVIQSLRTADEAVKIGLKVR